ncbi:SMC-Scp complex subunit ScpB [Micromonospora sp. CA-259024]|uniref:SMC-Scp complex subunit ScpB n=1 Tax=Micromonospora sp. CA-259024 TaxID=3239965 RepID=UPI003D8B8363
MSDEERRDSLADQAAAWVPPWDRPRPPAASTPEADDVDAQPEADDGGYALLEADGGGAQLEADDDAQLEADGGEVPPEADGVDVQPDQSAPAPTTDPRAEDLPRPTPSGEPEQPGDAAGVPRREVVGKRRATAAPAPAPELSDAELRGALEAILLVVDEPVSELVLAQVLEQPAERVGPMLDEIAAGYTAAGHGFELRRAAGGWRLYTRPEYATYVERFVLDGQSVRLTQAALETLAVVAYKQPVTRSRISAIRGVNCDGVIRTLVTRGLVEECGTEPDSGAFLYRTTTLFLEKLGLNTVDELPPLAPFLPDDVEELADATR